MRRCEGTDPNSLAFGVWVSNIRTAIRNKVPLGEDTGANHKKNLTLKLSISCWLLRMILILNIIPILMISARTQTGYTKLSLGIFK